MSRNFFDRVKTAVVHLLLPAFEVQFYNFNLLLIIKISNVRIIKGYMSIFSYSQTNNVNRMFAQKIHVFLIFVELCIFSFWNIIYMFKRDFPKKVLF